MRQNMKTILITDDKQEVRELVEVTFRGNYEIIQAESGSMAVEMAKKHKPDLILMDIMMPGEFDGLEATRILKNDPETKNIIIVILTAKGQQSDIETGLNCGADDYFKKPFSPLELIRKVDYLLDQS